MTVSVEEFACKCDYCKRYHSPISLQPFSDWFFRGLTFDDGTRAIFATPFRCCGRKMTAVCWVATGELGSCRHTWLEDPHYRLMFATVPSCRLRNGECWRWKPGSKARVRAKFFALCRTLLEAAQPNQQRSRQNQPPVTPPHGDLAGRFQFLSPDDLRQLSESGVEVGSHSLTHSILGALTPESARGEIACKSEPGTTFGKTACAFASRWEFPA
jgi:hypothetical protein